MVFAIHIYKRTYENIYEDTNVEVGQFLKLEDAVKYIETFKAQLNDDETYVLVKIK